MFLSLILGKMDRRGMRRRSRTWIFFKILFLAAVGGLIYFLYKNHLELEKGEPENQPMSRTENFLFNSASKTGRFVD